MTKLRILIISPDAATSEHLECMLQMDSGLHVVAWTAPGEAAYRAVQRLRPDLILLGAEIPPGRAADLTCELMIIAPLPIVVLQHRRSEAAAQQMVQAGAIAALALPEEGGAGAAAHQGFCTSLKTMAGVKVVRHWRRPGHEPAASLASVEPLPARLPAVGPDTRNFRLLAIAASTGGPSALQCVLAGLPQDFPWPILVVQHITSGFTEGLVSWLGDVCKLKVKVALDGEPLLKGTAYLAPDAKHLGVSTQHSVAIAHGPAIQGFRPSAIFLFTSVAKAYGRHAAAMILTGMGSDGVDGLKSLKQAGGHIIAQDERSSVVFGMPAAAIQAGLADSILPLEQMSQHLLTLI